MFRYFFVSDVVLHINNIPSSAVAAVETNATSKGQTALRHAIFNNEVIDVHTLLGIEVEVDAVDENGWTALHCAVFEGHTDIVIALLAKGATIDATDLNGCTALHLAASKGHKKIIDTLLKEGATIDATELNGYTALHCAAFTGHKEIVNTLLGTGADVNATNRGCTALHLAASAGHTDIIVALLAKGANANAVEGNKSTALHCAVLFNHKEVIFALLATKKAKVNEVDKNGCTALHYAAFKEHYDVIEQLVDHGAWIKVENVAALCGTNSYEKVISIIRRRQNVLDSYLGMPSQPVVAWGITAAMALIQMAIPSLALITAMCTAVIVCNDMIRNVDVENLKQQINDCNFWINRLEKYGHKITAGESQNGNLDEQKRRKREIAEIILRQPQTDPINTEFREIIAVLGSSSCGFIL